MICLPSRTPPLGITTGVGQWLLLTLGLGQLLLLGLFTCSGTPPLLCGCSSLSIVGFVISDCLLLTCLCCPAFVVPCLPLASVFQVSYCTILSTWCLSGSYSVAVSGCKTQARPLCAGLKMEVVFQMVDNLGIGTPYVPQTLGLFPAQFYHDPWSVTLPVRRLHCPFEIPFLNRWRAFIAAGSP